jgi:spore coat polysaccharide biosynthesis protein SpsF
VTVVASVQARLGSTRLPGKVLYPLGDRRVVEWVYDRAQTAAHVDLPALAVGDADPNTALTTLADRRGWSCVVGPEDDLLARHLCVVSETGADLLVRITGDCPFVPPDEIDRVVATHRENDARYTTNHVEGMPIGTAVDVIEPALLDELAARDETHPVALPRSAPDEWGVAHTAAPDLTARGPAHAAVDTPADYWRLSDAVAAVGPTPEAVLDRLTDEGKV